MTRLFYFYKILKEDKLGLYQKYPWLRNVFLPKKHGLHHIIPSSRGGSNEEENILIIKKDKHEVWHELYANFTPREAKFINIAWRNDNGKLRKDLLGKKKLKAYLELFGDVSPHVANQMIAQDWEKFNVWQFRKNKNN